MFVAVVNLGAGGTEDVALSDMANGVLYGCFAIMGLFAGGVANCKRSVLLKMGRASSVSYV